ncbi:TIGR03943 family putative permease subunit [Paenibacillus qinlingensis]|uniref:Repeat protein (TIGR03943 family) n=1 Tax=Paenibacillus qinlingensis TaxID=1837343 RepID=A0ABU1NR91_9BACL|nr:TIGR03943 family protein [Paenibacillus qinlingensis]MDR6550001.1 putative repeat protein (TIGR03943 family) [Paenibacillus qinlingensis]
MNHIRVTSFHQVFRTLILLGFSSYIVILSKSDTLQLYIAPRMMIYVKLASVLLYIIACSQGYMALRSYWGRPVACECNPSETRSPLRHVMAYGLLLLPLILGFLLPDTALNSTMVAAKGMNLSAATSSMASTRVEHSTLPSEPEPVTKPASPASQAASPKGPLSESDIEQLFKAPDEWNEDFAKMGVILYHKDRIIVEPEIYMEILSTVDLFKENFIGKEIELTGFVYREDKMKTNQFVVGRFAMSCCSADASPYGVLVEFPSAQTFPQDKWVKVTGTVQSGNYNSNEIFTIAATHIEEITAPSSPYVYPHFEPLTVLK